MNVSPPNNWGKIQGTVTGVTCGGQTVGVPATIRLNLVGSTTGTTLTADGQGRYAWWLPKGRYEVIVAKDRLGAPGPAGRRRGGHRRHAQLRAGPDVDLCGRTGIRPLTG